MKILIIGDKTHVFIYNLVKWLLKSNSSIESIDAISRKRIKHEADKYYNRIFSYEPYNVTVPFIRRFYKDKSKNKYFKKILKRIEGDYDIVHIHYVEHRLVENADFLAQNISGKLIVTFWGSDFYRSSEVEREKMLPLLKRADNIGFENPEMLNELAQYYKKNFNIEFSKLSIARFGLAPLEDLNSLELSKNECKAKLKIPNNSIAVCIGYNASIGQQHFEIFDSLSKMNNINADEIYLILPLTYGGNAAYIDQIIEKVNSLQFKFKIYTGFLSNKDVAILRKASDYFINLQITDQLSGSMLEHIFANNVVITGSWLPYDVLSELGIELVKIDQVNQIGKVLEKLIQSGAHLKNESGNSKIIYNNSYWGNCISAWNKLYE